MTYNIFLIAVIILLVICFIVGCSKGILGIFFGIIYWVVILGTVYVAQPRIETYMADGPVQEKVETAVRKHIKSGLVKKENETIDSINDQLDENGGSLTEDAAADTSDDTSESESVQPTYDFSSVESVGDSFSDIGITLPSAMKKAVAEAGSEALNAAGNVLDNLRTSEEDQVDEANDTISQNVAAPIASVVIKGIALLISIILALIISRILGLIINAVNHMPVVGGLSRVLGGIWGLVVGFIIIWLIMDLATCFSLFPFGEKIMTDINNSVFLNNMYMYNPLNVFLNI